MQQRGLTLIDSAITLAVIALLTVALLGQHTRQQAEADVEITRHNALALLQAGTAWWSANRTAPPDVATLVAAGHLDTSIIPQNRIGGDFTITAQPVGGGARIVVGATITRPGDLQAWRRRLEAATVVGNQLQWHRIVTEIGTGPGLRGEAFKSMY